MCAFLRSWLHLSGFILAFHFVIEDHERSQKEKQELEEKVRCMSKELKRLQRQRRSSGQLRVFTGQWNTAQALMAMREGEPTAAMAFLKAKRAGEPPAATRWVEVE